MEKNGGRPKKETTGLEKEETIIYENKKTTGFKKEETKKKPNVNENENVNENVNVNENENVDVDENVNAEVFKFYESNIGVLVPTTAATLLTLIENYDSELIKEAIKRACNKNARNMAYIEAILKDWQKKGYKVLADVVNEQKRINQNNEFNYLKSNIQDFNEYKSLYEN